MGLKLELLAAFLVPPRKRLPENKISTEETRAKGWRWQDQVLTTRVEPLDPAIPEDTFPDALVTQSHKFTSGLCWFQFCPL